MRFSHIQIGNMISRSNALSTTTKHATSQTTWHLMPPPGSGDSNGSGTGQRKPKHSKDDLLEKPQPRN